MKIIRYRQLLGALAAVALLATSCDLSENPKDQIPESEAYSNSKLTYLNTVASLYGEVGGSGGSQGLGGTDRGIYDLNTFTSDEAILPTRGGDWDDGGLWRDLYQHKWTVDNAMFINTWEYLYRVIGKANDSLDKLTPILEADPDNKELSANVAEIRAFRAMYYYYTMDLFGNIPLVLKRNQKVEEVEQSTRSQVFDFVVKELQAAIPHLSADNSSNPGLYYGRITQPVAYFLLAKLALNSEVYADDNWEDGSNDGKYTFTIEGKEMNAWQAVVYYADKITELGYQLEPNYATNFAVNNEVSKENIFVIPMDPATYSARMMYMVRSRHYEHGMAYAQGGWNGASLTPEALMVFRKGKEDPRLELCFYTGKVTGPDGNFIKNGDVDLEYAIDNVALNVSGTPFEKTAGARWKKYEIDITAEGDGQLVHNDYVLFRYADVLLMKAEALVRDGKSGDEPFNQVRARVGASSRPATLDNILDERLMELNWEGHRRQDLIRFGKYNIAIADREASPATRTVFPIPAKAMNTNQKLNQNPGY